MSRTRILIIAACALAAAAAVPGVLGRPKVWEAGVVAAAVAVLGLLAGLLTDRVKGALADRDALTARVGETVYQPADRLPRVREITDAVSIGVHPAAVGRSGDRVPAYVSRDIDAGLRDALRTSGFTLLVGEASAGKTRAAFEAIQAVLPGHMLVVPSAEGDVMAAVKRARGERACVLWLDDLRAFLGSGGISRKDIAELLAGGGHYRVVLATIRAVDESRLIGRLMTTERGDQLLDAGQGVLDQVGRRIFLERLFSADEQDRARTLAETDERLAAALPHADHTGIAEYVAWGPQLFGQWEDAWTRGIQPRGAALIAAAVDCRRAGFTGPLPRALLDGLHESYLRDRGGAELVPEDIDAAWTWALSLRAAGSPPLRAEGAAGYGVFGYLVDEYRRRQGEIAPERAVRAALEAAGPADANGIAMTAWQQGRDELALTVLERQYAAVSPTASPDDPVLALLTFNLAVTALRRDRYGGDLGPAERELRRILAVLDAQPQADPGHRHTVRGTLANVLFARDKLAEAEAEYRAIITARTAMLGAGHRSTLVSRNNLALLLTAMNRLDEAEDEHRSVLEARRRALGPEHPQTQVSEANLAAVLNRRAGHGPPPA